MEDDHTLIPVEDVGQTALGEHVSAWSCYRLIREGQLRCVRVGRRVFLTPEIIRNFIEGGGTK